VYKRQNDDCPAHQQRLKPLFTHSLSPFYPIDNYQQSEKIVKSVYAFQAV